MHKAISTKVQGKTSFETKTQQSQSSFLIFYFLCDFWIFDTKNKEFDNNKIKNMHKKTSKQPTAKTASKTNKHCHKA